MKKSITIILLIILSVTLKAQTIAIIKVTPTTLATAPDVYIKNGTDAAIVKVFNTLPKADTVNDFKLDNTGKIAIRWDKVTTIQSQVTLLSKTVTDNAVTAASQTATVQTNLNTQVALLQQQISALGSAITTLQEQNTLQQQQLNKLQASNDDLVKRNAAFDIKFAALKAALQ